MHVKYYQVRENAGNDVCYDTVYLGEGRAIGDKCLTETKY